MSLIVGAIVFAVATVSVILTASVVSARLYPDQPWARLLATAIIACVEVLLVTQAIGAIGILEPAVLAAITIALGAAALVVRARRQDWRPARPLRWPLPTWLTLVLSVFALGVLAINLGRPSTGLDTLQYHYPLIAHWLGTGNLTEPATLGIGMYAWFYPSNVEVLQLWTVAFFGRDVLVSVAGWVFFGLAIGTIAGVVRRIGASLITSVLTGLAFVTIPLVLGTQLRSGQVDLAATAFFAAAAFFALGIWRSGRYQDAALAGLSLGLAAGSKLVTLPFAAFLGAIFAVVLIIAARSGRLVAARAWRLFGITAVATFAAGAFFYIRNLVVVGNPAFPTPLPGFDEPWFPVDLDVVDSSLSTYVLGLDPHPWIVGPWLLGLWIAGIAALAALVVVPVLLLRTRRNTDGTGEAVDIDISVPAENGPNRNDPIRPPTTGGTDDGGGDGGGVAVATRPVRTRPARDIARRIDVPAALVIGWIVPLGLFGLYLVTPTSAGGPEGYPLLFGPNMRYAFAFLAFALIGLTAAIETRSTRVATYVMGGVIVLNAARMLLGLAGAPNPGPIAVQTIIAGFAVGAAATAAGGVLALTANKLRDRAGTGSRRLVLGGGAVVAVVAFVAMLGAAYYYTTDNRYGFSGEEQGLAHEFVQELEDEDGVTIAHATFPPIYPLWGSRLQNRVVLAADHDAVETPGVAVPFDSESQLLDFVAEEDPDYLVIWDVSFSEWMTQNGIPEDDADEIVRRLDAWDPREAEWASANPDLFRLVDRDGDVYIFEIIGNA